MSSIVLGLATSFANNPELERIYLSIRNALDTY